MTRLHIYRAIMLGVIALAFVVGYHRHGTIADAAFTAMIVSTVALVGFGAGHLHDAYDKWRGKKRD
jgi:uncharacterized membrane protein